MKELWYNLRIVMAEEAIYYAVRLALWFYPRGSREGREFAIYVNQWAAHMRNAMAIQKVTGDRLWTD